MNLTHLLSVASPPLSPAPIDGELTRLLAISGSRGQELMEVLGNRNGFYAFESALLVRPLSYESRPLGLFQWNAPALWKSKYKVELSSVVFFAEDIFGVQFCIKDDAINAFDPETGDLIVIAHNFDNWWQWIFEDSKVRTGWPLAHSWQQQEGALRPGTRLLPKVPFVLGGQFAIENLYALDDAEGMRYRASIANQLLNCPDGSKVVLDIQHTK